MDHPLKKNSPQLKHFIWLTQSHEILPPELHTYRYFYFSLDLSLYAHRQGEMGKTSKGCGLLKSKLSVKEHFFNTATPNTAGKKFTSCQCLLYGGEASCLDPASAAICRFSSPALFSVWSHLSRHSTLGQHSQAGGRTGEELSSELPTLLLEDFPPAQMCSDSPSAPGGTIEGLQLKQLLKDTAKCDCNAFCLLGCLAPCDRFVAPTQT